MSDTNTKMPDANSMMPDASASITDVGGGTLPDASTSITGVGGGALPNASTSITDISGGALPDASTSITDNRVPLDVKYANECIDNITTSVETMYDFYNSLSNSMLTCSADYDKLHAMHNHSNKMICTYYQYLATTNVPFKDSYITHWLNTDRVIYMFEDVESFLEL
jgi:hypothetical protein